MQSQLVCSGCGSILLYPRGATNVCCAVCITITSVPPPACRCGHGSTLLRRLRNFAYVYKWSNECEMFLLSYCEPCTDNNQSVCPYQLWQLQDRADVSFWSSICQVRSLSIRANAANPPRTPIPLQRPASTPSPSTSAQTVVVENPMSVDENGKLVINVVVDVTTKKKS